MSDPMLVEVLRGPMVESFHRGAVVVADADGGVVLHIGDIDRPVFPRSAVKAIQALPLVESGAAEEYGYGNRELALACASHSGEAGHVDLVRDVLTRVDLDERALECGTHWPLSQDATIALARDGGEASALHNNCSGKHAGFLCTCRRMGLDHRGYVAFDHPLQHRIRTTMSEVTGVAHDARNAATDGCSIPTYAIPLKALAHGFAKMTTGKGLSEERAGAAKRLLGACMAEPFYTSGSGTADMTIMGAAPGRIFAKTGAEGVYCAAVPELGLGVALKCDDGAARASEVMISAVLARLLKSDAALSSRLQNIATPAISSRRGAEVGRLRPGGPLAE
jgi:L-asparaginase II